LVVIAIIAILMGVLLPALGRVREQARQRSCATRVRQHLLAMTMYADENSGKLPLPRLGGYWLQDIDRSTVNFMLKTNMTRDMFYCPSNDQHQRFNDLFWLFPNGTNPPTGNGIWDGTKFVNTGGYIVGGYCYVMDTAAGRGSGWAIRAYKRDKIQKKWLRTTAEKFPSMRELVVDSIMGQREQGRKWGRNFGRITVGGIPGQTGGQVWDSSSHLKGAGAEPVGGNQGYLDTHVEWVPFKPTPDDLEGSGVVIGRVGDNNPPAFFWW
jgi:type II secretory pathway pseudopilin PulG